MQYIYLCISLSNSPYVFCFHKTKNGPVSDIEIWNWNLYIYCNKFWSMYNIPCWLFIFRKLSNQWAEFKENYWNFCFDRWPLKDITISQKWTKIDGLQTTNSKNWGSFFKMWKPWCYSFELRASDVEFGWSRTTVFAGEFYVTHQENFLVGGMQF